MKNKANPTLFLDRDGTINVDLGPEYLSDPNRAKLITGAGKAIAKAYKAGFKIVVITNQAGVAKGFTPKESLPIVHRRIEELIAAEAGLEKFKFDDIRVCMHHPNDKCKCRKPETGMLEESIPAVNADLSRSFFVGDKSSDLICGTQVGLRTILVLTGHGVETQAELQETTAAKPVGIVPSLTEAVDLAIRLRDQPA